MSQANSYMPEEPVHILPPNSGFLPCPFCNATSADLTVSESVRNYRQGHEVHCNGCCTTMWTNLSPAYLRYKWNHRYGLSNPDAADYPADLVYELDKNGNPVFR